MKFHVPPRNQGQIVEVSYAMIGDMVIKRRYDKSDRTKRYYVSRARINDEGDYWNAAPANRRWREVSAEEVEQLGEGA